MYFKPVRRDTSSLWRLGLGLAFLFFGCGTWEIMGRTIGGLLMAPFTTSVQALIELTRSGILLQALVASNQTMVLGFGLSLLVGIPLGLLTGRVRRLERFLDLYFNFLLVTPMAAIIPLLMIALGIGLASRVIIVFVFAFVIVTVNTRAGLRNIDPSLIEMARSFGASEMQIWRTVLLPGTLPAMMAGIRLGLGRSLTGMVTVELLLVAVGLGHLVLNYMGTFQPEKLYAVVLAIVIEAVTLMNLAKFIEARLLPWRHSVAKE